MSGELILNISQALRVHSTLHAFCHLIFMRTIRNWCHYSCIINEVLVEWRAFNLYRVKQLESPREVQIQNLTLLATTLKRQKKKRGNIHM